MRPYHLGLLAYLLLCACFQAAEKPSLNPRNVEQKMLDLQKNFNVIDTDRNDGLSPQEVKQAMVRSGSKDVSEKRIQKIIEFYDFNKDGKIELREAQSGAVSGPEAMINKIQ